MRRRRSIRPRAVIQSYKQVKQLAPVARAASTNLIQNLTDTVDSYSGPTAANNEVPTGAVVKYIEVQVSVQNLINVAAFLFVSIQHVRSGQTAIDPRAAGGNPQRNQVHRQILRCVGQNQNVNLTIKFKIPPKFQRCREGDKWVLTTQCDQIFTEAHQIIYKFYR